MASSQLTASSTDEMASQEVVEIGEKVSKRKNTSFKITNILPSRPPSHDPEESGDDDPDDSHTEDISEHFEHVYNAPNMTARGRFNILPCPQPENNSETDSMLKLVSTASISPASANFLSSSAPTMTMSSSQNSLVNTTITATAGVTAQFPNSNSRHNVSLAFPPHGPKDRFKVVKIVSSMPLRRGRWQVVDYPDKEKQPPPQPTPAQASVVPPSANFANIDAPEAVQNNSKNIVAAPVVPQTASVTTASVTTNTEQTDAASRGNYFNESGAAPLNTAVRTVQTNNLHTLGAMTSQNSETNLAVQPQQQPQPSAGVVVTTHHTYQAPHAPIPMAGAHQHMPPSQPPPQQQQQPPTTAVQPPQQAAPQQVTQPVVPQQAQKAPVQQQQPQQQPQQTVVQPAAVQPAAVQPTVQPQQQPSNHHAPQNAQQQQPQQPQHIVPTTSATVQATVASAQQPQYVRPVDLAAVSAAPTQQQSQQSTPRSQYPFIPAQSGTGSAVNSIPPSRDPKQSLVGVAVQSQSQVGTPTIGIQPVAAAQAGQNATGVPPSIAGAPPPAVSASAVTQPVASAVAPATAPVAPVQAVPAVSQQSQPAVTTQTYLESANRDSHPIASEELVERLEEISTQQGSPDAAEDSESASGTNQGAIDNRIEQAMDLVKSHLMNAVRSEVEELKEKIIKLEETISQQQIELTKQHTDFRSEVGKLQNENEFLKNHVAPDVLVQLSNLPPQPINTTTTATTTTATTQQQPQ